MKGDETGARWGVLSSCWRLGSTLAILWIVGLSACAGPRHPMGIPPEEPRPGARVPYVIGVTDRLTISVWKSAELSVQIVVRSDGKISVPLPFQLRSSPRSYLGLVHTGDRVSIKAQKRQGFSSFSYVFPG